MSEPEESEVLVLPKRFYTADAVGLAQKEWGNGLEFVENEFGFSLISDEPIENIAAFLNRVLELSVEQLLRGTGD